jgi:hypothetical protein
MCRELGFAVNSAPDDPGMCVVTLRLNDPP